VLVTEGAGFLEVALIGDDDTGFALDRLDQEGGEVGAGGLEGLAQSGLVVVCDGLFGAGDGAANTG
jgi:hypothetical protein